MRKYLLTCLLMLFVGFVYAQKKSPINIVSTSRAEGTRINGVDVIKLYQGVLEHEGTTLTSDSAYLNKQANTFDAFGNVHIIQGDTLNVYADKLNYNGNTKIAILTNNVRMVDKDATLTTNYLTYNTATRYGTYTGGGKLVNKENVLTSKNGYYFALTRDAYFRYNVVLDTKDNIIKTDTLRYNSGSRISYFLGPTHIYGKKDKDTLYTENGLYNTQTEQAFFGKKNRYSQGTKSLKGDSLFYDGIRGFGRAINRITFIDTEQKIMLKGDLGTYYKADERTVVTRNAYVTIVTEEKDTTRIDTVKLNAPGANKNIKAAPASKNETVTAKTITANNGKQPTNTPKQAEKINLPQEPEKVKRDTIYMAADTLQTQIITFKALKQLQELRRLANIKDTTLKDSAGTKNKKVALAKSPKVLVLDPPGTRAAKDSSYLQRNYFKNYKYPPDPPAIDKKQPTAAELKKRATQDSIRRAKIASDSVYMVGKVNLSDTARIRIVSAFHNAKIFKSDLQAKADSMFFSYSDSTIRLYVNPMIWTQGSQLSGDTVYLQMKDKKLNNMDMFPNSFIANIEAKDSTYFNQVGGKKVKGYFKDNKLERLFVDGNAESIYFIRDSVKVTDMHRSLSSRIRVNFKNNKAANVMFITKPEHRYLPIGKATEEDKILKGFIWKPKDRPVSKESIIPSFNRKPAVAAKKPATKTGATTTPPNKGKNTITSPTVKSGTTPDKPANRVIAPTIKRDSTVIAKPDTLNKKPSISNKP